MFASLGTIKYSRKWCWIEVDHDLGRYLRKLLLLSVGLKLQRPSHHEHITIVSAHDEVSDKNLWDFSRIFYENTIVRFELLPQLYTNGNAFWYDVSSKEATEIRSKLGLGECPINLHMAIGYLKEGKQNG